MESWKESYAKGCRIIDADLALTSDSILVLRHDWKDNLEQGDVPMSQSNIWKDRNGSIRHTINDGSRMSFHTFMHTPIYRNLTPMSCVDMLDFMDKHSDLYVATDMKDDIKFSYQFLVDLAYELGLSHVLDRIIISCYTFEEYATIMSIHPFKEKTIRQYINCPHNYYELVEFCVDNNIPTVNLSSCYMYDEGVKLLISKGIRIYVAVIDDLVTFEQCRQLGIYGCVSNYLYEKQLIKSNKL